MFAQDAARDLRHGKLATLDLPLGQLYQSIVMTFRAGLLFIMCSGCERGAEHEPGSQQPNPDHFDYPATGVEALNFAKSFLNALHAAALFKRNSETTA
ncbi:MAG: hypothetical protein ABI150_00805 [Nitrobacter sp.]